MQGDDGLVWPDIANEGDAKTVARTHIGTLIRVLKGYLKKNGVPSPGGVPPRTIRSAGAKLIFLPPRSPDLNPIEQEFAKLKTLLRRTNARTIEAA